MSGYRPDVAYEPPQLVFGYSGWKDVPVPKLPDEPDVILPTFPMLDGTPNVSHPGLMPAEYYGWRPPGWSKVVDVGESAKKSVPRAPSVPKPSLSFPKFDLPKPSLPGLPDIPSIPNPFAGLTSGLQTTVAEGMQTMQLLVLAPMILMGIAIIGLIAFFVVKGVKKDKEENKEEE